MRSFLLETIDHAVAQCDLIVIGGMTGTGKTDVIVQLDNGLDLERHANHRGSSFGKRVTAQPSGIDFENRLAIDVLKKRNYSGLALETEVVSMEKHTGNKPEVYNRGLRFVFGGRP